jgi:outer membrane protein TolC
MTHSTRALALSLLICSGLAPAADQDPYFPKPSYFRKYFARVITKVDLEPPVHLEDYVVEGRLELSLKSYLDLVMANNPNISLQRMSVVTSQDAITRAFGQFDPTALASFSATRTLSETTSATAGASTLNTLSQPLTFGVTQTLQTGTQYNVNFADYKTSSNSLFATVNPAYNSALSFSVSQPLLRGRGAYVTRLPLMIARGNLKQAQLSIEDTVTQLVLNAEQAYWSVVGAGENVRVAESSLKLADEALKRAQKELQLGASSPLDIFQPQQTYANAELALVQVRYALSNAEDALRLQIGADLSPKFREMPVVPTEPLTPPPTLALDKQQLVETAIEKRRDVAALRQALYVDDLQLAQANDQMRPSLSLGAQYVSSGIGGNLYELGNVFANGAQSVTIIPGGVSDALRQLFGFGLPTYGFSLNLTLPIKNHTAQANLTDQAVNKRQDALRLRVSEQNVRLAVVQAYSNLESSRASVALAKTALDFAQKRVDAEEKKYDLGTEQIFFVLAAQTDLTTAESALVTQMINFRLNQVALLRSMGTLLEERGIVVQ